MARPLSPRVAAYARAAAQAFYNIEVSVGRQSRTALDEDTGLISTVFDTEFSGYSGPAKFWMSNDSQVVSVGDGDYSTVSTFISLPWDASPVPQLDEYVVITSSYEDPSLQDKVYRIVGVDGGGVVRAARRLQVASVSDNRDTRE